MIQSNWNLCLSRPKNRNISKNALCINRPRVIKAFKYDGGLIV